jgi:hypothetical protein
VDLPKTKELAELVKYCRKSGIKSLKFGEFQIELDSSALFPESNYKKRKESASTEVEVTQTFTDEDALFWSSTTVEGGLDA